MLHMYMLRTATPEDLLFLFCVSTIAMLPVRLRTNPALVLDLIAEFETYKNKFEPDSIQIIVYNGLDVGRLRVVRSNEEIYIGGIQLLSEYQKLGIGTAIMNDLVEEANTQYIPITLEVSEVNTTAQHFYNSLGFIEIGKQDTNILMKYIPI